MLPTVSKSWLDHRHVTVDQYEILDQILIEKSSLFEGNPRSWDIIRSSVQDAIIRLDAVYPAICLLSQHQSGRENTVSSEDGRSMRKYFIWIESLIFWSYLHDTNKSSYELMKRLVKSNAKVSVGYMRTTLFGVWSYERLMPFVLASPDVNIFYYWMAIFIIPDDNAWLLAMCKDVHISNRFINEEHEKNMHVKMAAIHGRIQYRLLWLKKIFIFFPDGFLACFEHCLSGFNRFKSPGSTSMSHQGQQSERSDGSRAVSDVLLDNTHEITETYLSVHYWDERINHRTLVDKDGLLDAETLIRDLMQYPGVNYIMSINITKRLEMIESTCIKRQLQKIITSWCMVQMSSWVRSHMEDESFVIELDQLLDRLRAWFMAWSSDVDLLKDLFQEWDILSEHSCEIFSIQYDLLDVNETMSQWQKILIKHQWFDPDIPGHLSGMINVGIV